MSDMSGGAQLSLSLAEDPFAYAVSAPWIGRLIDLGSHAASWSIANPGRQLVIAISVPERGFAATLIGCGWMMASSAPALKPVRETASSLMFGTPVRVVTPAKVVTDYFRGVDEERDRLCLGYEWKLDKILAITALSKLAAPRSVRVAEPGIISRMAGLAADWPARICDPPADLALIGTLRWLREDIAGLLGRGSEQESIANILMPEDLTAATWSTRLYAAARLEEELPLAPGLRAVVLDGATAVKYLPAIESNVVIAVLDRSIADQSAAELLVHYRNSRGVPLLLKHDIRWTPPSGVEALGFWVAL